MNNEHVNLKKAIRYELILVILFSATFGLYVLHILPTNYVAEILFLVGLVGFIPVARSAFRALKEKQISVDLLATIALFFSFISAEWGSMLFINLMLAGARMLDLYTKRRVRLSLETLIKLKPSRARVLKDGISVDILIADVKKATS